MRSCHIGFEPSDGIGDGVSGTAYTSCRRCAPLHFKRLADASFCVPCHTAFASSVMSRDPQHVARRQCERAACSDGFVNVAHWFNVLHSSTRGNVHAVSSVVMCVSTLALSAAVVSLCVLSVLVVVVCRFLSSSGSKKQTRSPTYTRI